MGLTKTIIALKYMVNSLLLNACHFQLNILDQWPLIWEQARSQKKMYLVARALDFVERKSLWFTVDHSCSPTWAHILHQDSLCWEMDRPSARGSPHKWGLGKGITEAKSYPRKNSAERRLRTQDLVTRRASTHQLYHVPGMPFYAEKWELDNISDDYLIPL
jgi:hypothetical protein